MPRFYGIEKFGQPELNKLKDGVKININFSKELRPKQLPIVEAYFKSVSNISGGGGIISVPCGYGKTVLALYILAKLGVKTLVVVHKEFLMNQWKERIEWVFEMTRLQDVRHRITGELPPGWRQRLALGCALLHRPEILFLDEPTSGVDPITRRQFWEFIKHLAQEGVTIFVTTHYMDEARNCERIVMINEGKIVISGRPPDIIHETFPDRPDADLNDVFVRLMSG